jgi:hypothetical protein
MSTVCFQRRTDHLTSVLTSLQSLATIKSINCVRNSHRQHLTVGGTTPPSSRPRSNLSRCMAKVALIVSADGGRLDRGEERVNIQSFDIRHSDKNPLEMLRSCTSKTKRKTAPSGMRDSGRRMCRGRRRNMAPGFNMKGRDLELALRMLAWHKFPRRLLRGSYLIMFALCLIHSTKP